MASILPVGDSWRALIRRKGFKTQCKTFPTKAKAEKWARKLEAEMDAGDFEQESIVTIAELIDEYRKLRSSARPIMHNSNEHYMLRHLESDLGSYVAAKLASENLIAWARMRRDQGAGGYTVNMELSKLGTVCKYAAAALGITMPDAIARARPLLDHLGLISQGGKRDRRLEGDEAAKLLSALPETHDDIFAFVLCTGLRRGEVCRVRWDDVDREKRLLLIRDRKHPRHKVGNDQWIPLINGAWEVLELVKKRGERIFPVSNEAVSDVFKSTCDALGIDGLTFHDLRHEGTSRLFETGYRIEQVALVTGHQDWRHLRRYTNLRPEDLHQGPRAA